MIMKISAPVFVIILKDKVSRQIIFGWMVVMVIEIYLTVAT